MSAERAARPGPADIRVAGCDLGKSAAKLVVCRVSSGGGVEVESEEVVEHDGQALKVFSEWYRHAEVASCAALGATGLHAEELVSPVVAGLPEDACLQSAVDHTPELTGPLNLVSVGARGYAVLVRSADGRYRYLENDKCSSGTGETMVKIAGRFGMSIAEADEAAQEASEAIAITARCSVFAKSEMTHFGNQGRPADALFNGYFASVAKYVAALLARARVDGPVYAIGGCARIDSLVAGLSEATGAAVRRLENGLCLEAIGAAVLAAEQASTAGAARLPTDPAALIQPRTTRFRTLDAPRDHAHRVKRLDAVPVPPGAEEEPSVLGLDLGSTGSKAVLTSISTGEATLDLYDRTRGNPVEASRRLIGTLLDETTPDVRVIALTGSGREAAATVVRAAFPELADRVFVQNEIVAHATAAIRCDPDGGESLSVVEIGGQDAKFIQISGGRIVESDMNKACSAGTGSFLEEQAVFFDIDDIDEFTRLAQESASPPELGQMCTVHVAEAAGEAANEGFSTEDLFGGFQYSVILNYINRVMGQRTFGARIFFQGKPATGPSLAWTLAAVTGREVVVPPNPGAMGAWGIALSALQEIDAPALLSSEPFELARVLEAKVVGRKEFQCHDKRCATLCSIERTTVEVGETKEKVFSGGACPKYEISTASRPKLPIEAPSAFDEREDLLAGFMEPTAGSRTVGLPLVGACYAYFPWLVTFLRGLGFGVAPLVPDSGSLARGEERCYSFDACAPVKIGHGTLDADVDTVFFPKILSFDDPEGPAGQSCVMEQGLPEMVRDALRARGSDIEIVHPLLSFADGLDSVAMMRRAWNAAKRLGAPKVKVARAVRSAGEVQREYEAGLAAIGRRTIAYGRSEGIPVVVVCGSLHVIHDTTMNAGIPRLLRDNGVLALPMDCYPIPEHVHPMRRIYWAESKRALRSVVAARRQGGVYPLMLSSFGCGPASFTEQFFSRLGEGYPYTALESDGHGGTAGYVTRIQAFLHAVRQHDGEPHPVAQECLEMFGPLPFQSRAEMRESRVLLPAIADEFSTVQAAVARGEGMDVISTGPSDVAALSLGQRDCSGKECLPYQIIWGGFRKYLEENPSDKPTLLAQGSGQGMCRFCVFGVKDQISLEKMGADAAMARPRMSPLKAPDAIRGFRRRWASTLTWDILYQLAAYYGAIEGEPGEAQRLYRRCCHELETLVEHPPRGAGGAIDVGAEKRALLELLGDASDGYAQLAERAELDETRRTVLLGGDFYLRLDRVMSDQLVRRFNDRSVHVIVEPMNLLHEYLAADRISDLFGYPSQYLPNKVVRRAMRRLREEFYGAVHPQHRWLTTSDVGPMLEISEEILEVRPFGETRIGVGSALHAWEQGLIDGIVAVGPWGCENSLLTESLLCHRTDIPILFVYLDGTPIDERRVNAFTFRLQALPPRSGRGEPSRVAAVR
ncbi:MAG: hypothetical protein JJLCMIEE_03009 [Acidimicrobiales bacterium]|nr:MAG: hypothetical protein EDR02_16965 [Actinomycetota bacterium]MBV6509894.1 hypothetical protein [Acidimicrobiales bacterium]RIK03288.1 MAG: hypothetical protein DCC48_16830 [Acidobacteriota bacterium]